MPASSKIKVRLDEELVRRGFFDDCEQARRALMAGLVSGRGMLLTKPGTLVLQGEELHVKGSSKGSFEHPGHHYVSRGGLKLEGALKAFQLSVSGLTCLDVGASTGGFTDCLLQFGAERVVAVDVGYAQFAWSLRCDERVDLFERTNICKADPDLLGAPFDLAVCDVSFTSISDILPAVTALLKPAALFCMLVKPQFEASSLQVEKGGIVTDPAVHLSVLGDVCRHLQKQYYEIRNACPSCIRGAKGNIEYFILAARTDPENPACAHDLPDLQALVASAWSERN